MTERAKPETGKVNEPMSDEPVNRVEEKKTSPEVKESVHRFERSFSDAYRRQIVRGEGSELTDNA